MAPFTPLGELVPGDAATVYADPRDACEVALTSAAADADQQGVSGTECAFVWRSAGATPGANVDGAYPPYPGSGHVRDVRFQSGRVGARAQLAELEDGFVDRYTRAVFFPLSLYSPTRSAFARPGVVRDRARRRRRAHFHAWRPRSASAPPSSLSSTSRTRS